MAHNQDIMKEQERMYRRRRESFPVLLCFGMGVQVGWTVRGKIVLKAEKIKLGTMPSGSG